MFTKNIFRGSKNKNAIVFQIRKYSQLPNGLPDTTNTNQKSPYSKEAIIDAIISLKNDIQNTTYVTELNEVANNVLREMERKKFSMIKFKMTIGMIILIVILALYDVITSWMSGQVNVITEKSLDDEHIKEKINIMCKNTITELVHSQQVQDDIAELLKIAIISLAEDKEVQFKITNVLESSVVELVHNDKIQQEVGDLLKLEIMNLTENKEVEEHIKKLLVKTIETASSDEQIHEHGGKLINGSIYKAFFGNVAKE